MSIEASHPLGTETHAQRQRASMAVFLLVGFGIPWATMLIARAKHVGNPIVAIPFLAGSSFCSVAGVLATYVDTGRRGVKELGRRCLFYRVWIGWWLYALFVPAAVHLAATLIYGTMRGGIGAIRPLELFHQWWEFYVFAFAFLQGPLGEELGWRGFLLPRLLQHHSSLTAGVIVGIVWAVWHVNVFFSSFNTVLLFMASAVALSILMTLLFLHTRGSVVLAMVMHWSGTPGKEIVRICFPAHEPPDWLRAAVVIAVAALVAAISGRQLRGFRLRPESDR